MQCVHGADCVVNLPLHREKVIVYFRGCFWQQFWLCKINPGPDMDISEIKKKWFTHIILYYIIYLYYFVKKNNLAHYRLQAVKCETLRRYWRSVFISHLRNILFTLNPLKSFSSLGRSSCCWIFMSTDSWRLVCSLFLSNPESLEPLAANQTTAFLVNKVLN